MELKQPNRATPAREPAAEPAPHAAWPLAIALSLALGVVFRLTAWHCMGVTFLPGYVWGPAAGVAILLYLWLARGRLGAAGAREDETASPGPAQVAWAALVITGFVTNALTFAPERLGPLALLSAIHLPALTWLVMGVAVLGRVEDPLERFAAAVKSIEVLVTGAIYAGVVAIFSGVTIGVLTALQVKLPQPLIQGTFAFLLGLIPVLAVASVYDPGLRPAAQPKPPVMTMTRIFSNAPAASGCCHFQNRNMKTATRMAKSTGEMVVMVKRQETWRSARSLRWSATVSAWIFSR